MAMSRSSGCSSLTRRPAIRISPSVIVSEPAMVLSRVDLPQPEADQDEKSAPSTARSMPCSTSVAEALDHPVDLEKGHRSDLSP